VPGGCFDRTVKRRNDKGFVKGMASLPDTAVENNPSAPSDYAVEMKECSAS
jgi:hypothetical protein